MLTAQVVDSDWENKYATCNNSPEEYNKYNILRQTEQSNLPQHPPFCQISCPHLLFATKQNPPVTLISNSCGI